MAARGGRGGRCWVEYLQILWLRGRWGIVRFWGCDAGGVVGGVSSDFGATRLEEWWMEYLHILGLQGLGNGGLSVFRFRGCKGVEWWVELHEHTACGGLLLVLAILV